MAGAGGRGRGAGLGVVVGVCVPWRACMARRGVGGGWHARGASRAGRRVQRGSAGWQVAGVHAPQSPLMQTIAGTSWPCLLASVCRTLASPRKPPWHHLVAAMGRTFPPLQPHTTPPKPHLLVAVRCEALLLGRVVAQPRQHHLKAKLAAARRRGPQLQGWGVGTGNGMWAGACGAPRGRGVGARMRPRHQLRAARPLDPPARRL